MSPEKQIKTQAGYVQVEGFSEAGAGYCCGSCKNLVYHADGDGKSGWCLGLSVPVRTYGCCNNWKLAGQAKRGYNGHRLKVVR